MARKKYKVAYPDNGGGRFSDKLSDKEWIEFNNIKRVSDNYSESVGMVLTMLLCAGLFQPILAASFGGTFILGKIIYGYGYKAWGPKGRMFGAPISALSFFALTIIAGYNAALTSFFA
ncbi:hypothetical protein GGI01_003008 [Coemansia sp. RSA 376]|nr:hypothetical protein GGI14_003033 [Coemansia sp. S680]KAJ2048716.1 hypothetical protein H4S04_003663 [Coemansia sp. S16]KAJ2054785.1 hypothetical protein GGH13_008084 [Coemansia sp. S155-1]KAJ2069709.1 hypothetical protein GGI08_000210 [Coemansia sp. S2]KAJ2101058.1 hypothetical protein GGI09_001955 [Coemansia sp. S100]KAJ2255037.1 hypothetical protein GGI13_001825 [Coemansia sp. RSA 455]KAJ2260420.1 hypothetical protein GGI01_003008 [Coemansia sp. RSA 376]KAJ2468401.1 hypothetical protei